MKKRIFALLLALCLLPTLSAFAAEDAAADEVSAREHAAYVGGRLSGLYVTPEGNILASDSWNKVVWDLSGEVPVRYAGRISTAGLSGEPQGRYHDAPDRLRAFFLSPNAIAPFLEGYAVADAGANAIRYIAKDSVQTLAGTGEEGKNDGVGAAVRFSRPSGLATDSEGVLYIADTGNGRIRTMAKNGSVRTFMTGLAEPTGLCWANGSLYVAETGKNRILKITDGQAVTIAGLEYPTKEEGLYYGGYADRPAAYAEFDHPQGIAVGADGTVYIADTLNHAVRMLKDGRVYTLARSENKVSPPVEPRDLALVGDTLLVACRGGLMKLPLGTKQFEDVTAADWCAPYAAESALRGLVRGTSETTFSPKLAANRAMFVTMLSRVHSAVDGAAVIDGEAAFEDIEEGSWYAAPARWAIDAGVIRGIDGKFVPNGDLTREQAAVMLYRYAQARDLETAEYADASLAAFTDAGSVSDWAEEAMHWAVGAGILEGADGRLMPLDVTNREQIAAVLLRFMDVYGL